jgi:3-oxoacyl-[acyl-carrier-protein] synthase II
MSDGRQVWVTGIGLLSSLGEGCEDHLRLLLDAAERPSLDETTFAPYPVHALARTDFAGQIPKGAELRQMGVWQRIGVYAAGLALDDAGISGYAELLDRADLVVAAGNGERDIALDERVVELTGDGSRPGVLNEALMKGLRPTLYLGELSNLLAGNIQIAHGVTGSSRTFKGEETAGVAAVEDAVKRIQAGQGDLFLVGGAMNAERRDLLLNMELGGNLWARPFNSVWQRQPAGGGLVLGSIGAFLVLESRAHAEARGAHPYARLTAIGSDRCRRDRGHVRESLSLLFEDRCTGLTAGRLAMLSGAGGVEPVTGEELEFLLSLEGAGYHPAIRAYGSRLGHGVEAHFPLGIALAALSLRAQAFYPPFDASGVEEPFDGPLERVLVTGLGHWRGEGLALLETAG